MKFSLYNNKLPRINSIILVCHNVTNIIGIVEAVQNDTIIILMLDRIGRMLIHKNDNWIQLNVNDIQTLKYSYKLFINKNINDVISDSYLKFKNFNNIK